MLTSSETADYYREVTDAQKTALETADAKWEEPTEEMIAQFNLCANRLIANYGRYNIDTGFFELGTIHDLTAGDVREILLSPTTIHYRLDNSVNGSLMHARNVRATFPIALSNGGAGTGSLTTMFHSCAKIEEIYILRGFSGSSAFRAFYNCFKLRVLSLSTDNTIGDFGEAFVNCQSLETIKVFPSHTCSVSLSSSSKLSPDSVSRVIAAKSGDKATTLTLHPTTFAQLTEEMIATAADKNIQLATV